ncbi:uncharacterized protein [Amphiura filiformis]|uniref:uncharacterized protein isoform X2 n=1 Tax=Amphiura filiformis TaxID=82378 RepID=UPI003B2154B8
MDQTLNSDHLRTKYSLANPEKYQQMYSSTSQDTNSRGTVCKCVCRTQSVKRRTAEFSHHYHHQINESTSQRLPADGEGVVQSGALGPHRRNTSATGHPHRSTSTATTTTTTDSYGILNISGHCLRQLKNLCGTYSMYHWSIFLFIYILLLSLNWSPCSALAINPPERISSTTEDDAGNTNFHRVDEYLRFLYPSQNDTNRVWSKIVRNSSYLNTGKKRTGRRASGKSRSALAFSSAEVMKRINAEREAAECQPRDTVLDAYEEIGIPKGYSTFIFPDCVVVKRCKNGGCCRDDEECVAAEHTREEVSMLFLINQVAIEKTIIQDTACECRPKPAFCPPPQVDCPNGKVWSYSECKCTCRYRCPKPFLQDEDSCECDCLMSNRECKNISRGRKNRKLSNEECDCVRRGLCATPPCLNGRFSISACTCVQSWS